MPHAAPRALERAGGIPGGRAVEKSDVRMRLERVDISKRRVPHTSNGTSVVQHFADIGAAAAHALKPCPRHQSVRIRNLEPSLDFRIAPHRAMEPQDIVHLK